MSKYVLVVDAKSIDGDDRKVVSQVLQENPGFSKEVADVREVPDSVVVSEGMIAYSDNTFAFFVPPLLTKEQLIGYANVAQMTKALGGLIVTINNEQVPFSTEATSMAFMNGLVTDQLLPNPPATVNWQIGTTTFKVIAAADFMVAARTVKAFVQSTFDALPAIFASIAAGTITTTAQIDAVFDAM